MKKRRDEKKGDTEEEFKEYFPAIYKEIKSDETELTREKIRTSKGTKKVRKFAGYNPGIIDFICRCKSKKEAHEIIDYMVDQKKISKEEAEALKEQLEKKGLRSFGPFREPGYYEKA